MTILVVDTAGLFPLALRTVAVEELESYLFELKLGRLGVTFGLTYLG